MAVQSCGVVLLVNSLLTSHMVSTSRSASLLLTQADDYLMAARNAAAAAAAAGFNPYATGGGLDAGLHSTLYGGASNPFGAYRSLEEHLYLERYGLLRPPAPVAASSMPSSVYHPPTLGFPSYLNFRYPTPAGAFLHPDFATPVSSAVTSGPDPALARLKFEEDAKGKTRDDDPSKSLDASGKLIAFIE